MRLPLAALLITLSYPASADPLSPVKTAELSARLYATGLELGDPLLLLSAAKLRKSLGLTASARLPEGGMADTEEPLSWQDMLASATELAADDETLLGLIDDVQAESTKGVSSGPVYNIGNLKNGGKDAYPAVEFVGGEYAEVYVEAKGATDLNLTIYDAQGRLVCSDTDVSHIAYCGWRPADTGNFTMKVENQGPQGAKYALMTN
jgi:hypothetical protein